MMPPRVSSCQGHKSRPADDPHPARRFRVPAGGYGRNMPGRDKTFEQSGTDPAGQAAEFVDTPMNEPGDQRDPAPAAPADTEDSDG